MAVRRGVVRFVDTAGAELAVLKEDVLVDEAVNRLRRAHDWAPSFHILRGGDQNGAPQLVPLDLSGGRLRDQPEYARELGRWNATRHEAAASKASSREAERLLARLLGCTLDQTLREIGAQLVVVHFQGGPPQAEPVQSVFRVISLTGRAVDLRCNPADTVKELLDDFRSAEGIPADQVRLISGNTQLRNEWVLSSVPTYTRGGTTEIRYILRLRGGCGDQFMVTDPEWNENQVTVRLNRINLTFGGRAHPGKAGADMLFDRWVNEGALVVARVPALVHDRARHVWARGPLLALLQGLQRRGLSAALRRWLALFVAIPQGEWLAGVPVQGREVFRVRPSGVGRGGGSATATVRLAAPMLSGLARVTAVGFPCGDYTWYISPQSTASEWTFGGC